MELASCVCEGGAWCFNACLTSSVVWSCARTALCCYCCFGHDSNRTKETRADEYEPVEQEVPAEMDMRRADLVF